MTPRVKARPIFLSAILILCGCAVTTYISFFYFRESEHWVRHTQAVRAAVGDLESVLNGAARARMIYLISGDGKDLAEYRTAAAQVREEIQRLRDLTRDNPVQAERSTQLESTIRNRLDSWEGTIALKQQGGSVDLVRLMPQNVELAAKSAALAGMIRDEETRLLSQRTRLAHRHFAITSTLVASSFILALLLLGFYSRLLNRELAFRQQAEQDAQQAYSRETALRQEEQQFRLFINAVKDYAIFALDSRGCVSSWNEGALRLKGYDAPEIIGKHFSSFYSEEDRKTGKPQRELEIATREGQVEDEGWRIRKNGSQFWANVVITAIRDKAGKLIGFAKVTRDFTDRMRAQEELRRANAELLAEVAERKQAERRLTTSEKSLRALSLHLLRTQDEERKRIGRELHDSLGQYVAMLKMNLDSLGSVVKSDHDGAAQLIARSIRLADDALREVRTISYLMYPPMLEEMGLKSAISWFLEGFSKRSSVQTTFDLDPEFGRLLPEVELALFRILQESLTNVHRHSGSSTATIRLYIADGKAVLEIRDRGRGIPSKVLEESGEDWMGSLGVGLRGMNERLRQFGGKLEVSSTENGTVVTANVPVGEVLARTRTA